MTTEKTPDENDQVLIKNLTELYGLDEATARSIAARTVLHTPRDRNLEQCHPDETTRYFSVTGEITSVNGRRFRAVFRGCDRRSISPADTLDAAIPMVMSAIADPASSAYQRDCKSFRPIFADVISEDQYESLESAFTIT